MWFLPRIARDISRWKYKTNSSAIRSQQPQLNKLQVVIKMADVLLITMIDLSRREIYY